MKWLNNNNKQRFVIGRSSALRWFFFFLFNRRSLADRQRPLNLKFSEKGDFEPPDVAELQHAASVDGKGTRVGA